MPRTPGGKWSVRADQASSGSPGTWRLGPVGSLPDLLGPCHGLLLDARVTAPADRLEVLQLIETAVAARNAVVCHQILVRATGDARCACGDRGREYGPGQMRRRLPFRHGLIPQGRPDALNGVHSRRGPLRRECTGR